MLRRIISPSSKPPMALQVTFSIRDTYGFSVDSSSPAVECQLVAAENNITVPFTVELTGKKCGKLALQGVWIGAMYTQATIVCGGVVTDRSVTATTAVSCAPALLCEDNKGLLITLVVLVVLLILAVAAGILGARAHPAPSLARFARRPADEALKDSVRPFPAAAMR